MTSYVRTIASWACLVIAASLASPSGAGAQVPAGQAHATDSSDRPQTPEYLNSAPFIRLVEGKRVRVVTAGGKQLTGVLTKISSAGLVLKSTSAAVPFDRVVRVELVPRRVRTAALAGLVAGGFVQAVTWLSSDGGEDGNAFAAVVAWAGAGIGAAGGAIAGAIAQGARGDGDLVFELGRTNMAVQFQPIVGLKGAGAAVRLNWR